jgi:formylglycine-generating enzyme required for sulfatase activity
MADSSLDLPDSSLSMPDSSLLGFCGFWTSVVAVEPFAEVLVDDPRQRSLLMMLVARLPRVVLSLGMAALLGSLAVPARAVTIDWVTVGDPGNDPDTTGDPNPAGAVADAFQIMKYEFTNQQYTAFLNSVDPTGTNPNSVYSASMGSNARGGITNTGTTNGSKYATKTNMGDKPVNYVNWFDAARVSNWLVNGATGTSSMETGAYTLNNATSGNAPAVNSGATFYIPTENQWYKAAYYKGGSTNAGYWDYATQSDTVPTAVTAGSTGNGSSGSTGNSANYDWAADWNDQTGNVTTVGTNGGASAYGAFDMSGNVAEWNDLTGAAGSSRGRRGGDWASFGAGGLSSSSRGAGVPSNEFSTVGFRLASPVAVPEPSTWVMGLAGIACGGYSLFRRRKRA